MASRRGGGNGFSYLSGKNAEAEAKQKAKRGIVAMAGAYLPGHPPDADEEENPLEKRDSQPEVERLASPESNETEQLDLQRDCDCFECLTGKVRFRF